MVGCSQIQQDFRYMELLWVVSKSVYVASDGEILVRFVSMIPMEIHPELVLVPKLFHFRMLSI